MIAFIVLFLPAVLSVWIWEAFSRANTKKKTWFYLLSLNVTLINLICFALQKIFDFSPTQSLFSLLEGTTASNAFFYLIMALPTAVAVAFLDLFFFKKVRLTVEEDPEEPAEDDNETTA